MSEETLKHIPSGRPARRTRAAPPVLDHPCPTVARCLAVSRATCCMSLSPLSLSLSLSLDPQDSCLQRAPGRGILKEAGNTDLGGLPAAVGAADANAQHPSFVRDPPEPEIMVQGSGSEV